MEIVTLKLKDLKPSSRNAKKHPKEQIDQIIESIKEFGFCDPIGIWGDENKIVEGHGRYQAAKKLGWKEIDCIRLDHLTDEQRIAYMHVHNQLTMNTDFDYDILNESMDEILNIDMEAFGFDFVEAYKAEEESNGAVGEQNENVRSVYMFNLDLYDETRTTGKYHMPVIQATDYIPNDLIGFNYALSSKEKDVGIHCYIDDYQIERLWNQPFKYLDVLRQYNCVLMPDFSMTREMPVPLKMWNCFKAKLIAQFWQDNGLTVIPIIRFSSPETWEWCYDGMPENSVVGLSVQSVNRGEELYGWWKEAVDLFIKTKKPKALLLYGNDIDYDFGDIPIYYYRNKITEKWKGE